MTRSDVQTATSDALEQLESDAVLAGPHELADLIDQCATRVGASRAVAYVVDLQQHVLEPLRAPDPTADDLALSALDVDATLAGRAYQTQEPQVQTEGLEGSRMWFPMVSGTQRLGVLGVTLAPPEGVEPGSDLMTSLERLAVAAAALITVKQPYGDTIVRLRRSDHLGVASELHYSILPPLSCTTHDVDVSAALEPCYEVAGDAIDYSVDEGRAQVAIFDGMGHGLQSAQCAVFTVAAYRSARRSGLGLVEIMSSVDDALAAGFGGELFSTSVVAELDTKTGALSWVNAGHPFPLLLRGGKVVKALEAEPRPPLGLGELLPGHEAVLGHEQLEPGDIVLLYTDGVVEARSPDGAFFGIDRLADLIRTQLAGGLSAPETMRRVVRDLLAHHEGQLTDDATLLMLQWRRLEA
ncbi:MAG TPA: PP2C family protein-serine/threonine phosphatase [Mycobacteriales bacterium]|nr:PP2C family protein-serine/threonine phosphatase [Mycobacteriales bacterium]